MLDYAAFPEQRQDLIRQILRDQGRVICADLARQMQVSEHTVRRDLHELSKEGICKKVYGGAVLQLADAQTFAIRKQHDQPSKNMIAQKCASLIKNESCIFIDAGTTNLAMTLALPETFTLTAVTNAPDIAASLLKHPNIDVIMLGGRIEKNSGGCVGSTALAQLKNILFDQAFIGGCAMSPESGLTGFNFDDCEFKKAVIAQSSQTIVGLTAEKIPAIARFSVARCEDIDILIVEEQLDKDFYNAFTAENVTILTI
ncbi:decarboxylase [Izhakiella australiensis]|uniref:Decarboxylase n=1 Tax=Izhakiella australiensis TaxID=1926881 RepID=A0A1S8YRS5_9GAMM|nr:DeoR/GlpR family DNA-binding transcription regulator [Izhakiella australiensis]OON41323.1 decarboxylase [Izhakiella australiensis]